MRLSGVRLVNIGLLRHIYSDLQYIMTSVDCRTISHCGRILFPIHKDQSIEDLVNVNVHSSETFTHTIARHISIQPLSSQDS